MVEADESGEARAPVDPDDGSHEGDEDELPDVSEHDVGEEAVEEVDEGEGQ
jgi:hypothetical protein